MPLSSRTRNVNPRLGTYFGIFASAFAALVLVLLIFEQLGASDALLRGLMLGAPLALYAAIGLSAGSSEPIDFFASGRRVPAFFNGLVIAVSAIGATGLVAATGLFFLNGFDAWCIVIGLTGGFVVMAILIAPFLRKFGAFTVPSYLGRRCESRAVRVCAAAVVAIPMLLVIAAEMRTGVFVGAWLTGQSEQLLAALLAAAVVLAIVLGGMRSASWANTSESIAVLMALIVPTAMVATAVTNLPFAQLSHGPVLRALGRLEVQQALPIPVLAPLSFELAGAELEPIVHRLSHPFGSVGPLSFVLASLTLMAGVAAAPWLLPRIGTTPSIYETRKSMGWATFVLGMIMLTVSAVAVFMREVVMDTLVGHSLSQLPAWFRSLEAAGLAGVQGQMPRLPISSFSFKRDAVLFALPIASGYPAVLVYLSLAGALAAAVAAASMSSLALGAVLAEDVVNGLRWEPKPNRLRLAAARVSIVAAVVLGAWLALIAPADPLDLLLWALALSASGLFPVIVLSIWWKRLNGLGAIAGMAVGLGSAVLALIAGEAAWLDVDSALAGVFGIPAGFLAAFGGTWLRPPPSRQALELVRDMRVPGGETVHDREMRLLRLKQRPRSR
ncbi:MAG: sodium:solute symporter [Hyphomicrobiaceae bacterium]|nr:sodium:solute symporter [Hyphomicrobiaceae bacterium]